MDEQRNGAHQELISVIRQVRSRWRLKLLLRGGVIVLLGALAAIALASLGLQSYKFSPASVTTLRFAVFGAFALLLGLWLVVPMRRRVTDMQVALYVEEHEKSLQAAILSAVDVSRPVAEGETPVPPAIVEKMVAQAIEKCRAIEGGKAIGRNTLRRLAVGLTTAAGVMALLFSIGPEFLRQGASALLVLSKSAEAASPYAITVQPGDSTVPKGSDQLIKAKLAGFRTNEVTLMIKEGGGDKIDRRPLVVTGEAGVYEGMVFDLKSSIEYYVEADGVKSPTYKMTVVELPAVSNLELEYIYPAYTGLPPQKVEMGGDVAALRGTEVRVKVTSTMTTPGGKLILDPGNPSDLAVQGDGKLTGSFVIGQDGYYHVELAGPRGEKVTASPKYTIDAIEDQAPTVSIEKPRRDIQANPVEEVVIKARADDDFGVKQLDLVYSVNGGPEKTVTLYGKGAKPLAEVSASHTVYLEELQVKPGDFVAYYAVAKDSDTVKGPKATSSDIYFVQIRPFGQNFREAQSQEGGGGGGGGGGGRNNQPGALSEQQRQVISATFNVERDRSKSAADKVKENTKFVELAQERLRTEVENLVQTMRQRLGGGGGENIQRIVELLPKAAAEMKNAEELLKSQKTKDALVPEQKALKHLQDAEQVYELEVRRQQQQGGGGGGGGGQMASELADLFQLQLDRQANQYETQQRAQQQSADQQIDELAEKLKELARRQLAQAEQQRRLRGQQQGQGGGSGQRALADEVEQAARQLEQLRREAERQGQQRQDLADAARRLQESANSMRQAAANGQDGGAQAQQAYQRLQEAQRLLQNNQTQQSGQSVKDLQKQADDLARQQKDVAQRVAGLDKAGDQRDAQAKQLSQEKNEMRAKVGDIEQQIGNLSRQALAANQRDAARKLQEAAGTIRDNMLQQKIEYSRSAMAGGSEYTKPIEQDIAGNIDQLRQKLGEAAKASDTAQQGQGLNRAANNMRDLARGLNSLGEQLDQSLGQQGQGQQAQQGGQGQQGEKGKGEGQGQGEKGSKGQGQGEKGQGQGEKGQGQGQGQGEKGQGQGQGEKGQGQGQGEKGQGQGEGKGDGKGGGKGEGSQRLGEGKGQGGKDAMTGNPAPQGSTNPGGDARPELSQGQIRQWANQANTLANDAADVRRQLQAGGIPVKDLAPIDDVVKALRALGDPKAYGDPTRLQQLYGTAVDKFKALEYEVRKKVDTTNDQLFLSGSDEVPPKYKDLIQEYYRKLSKKGGK